MGQIDWNRAPEGATHFGPKNEDWHAVWCKWSDDGHLMGWLADGDRSWGRLMLAEKTPERLAQMIPRPSAPTEQIASDEREAAIKAMCEHGIDAGDFTIEKTCAALYDAGYRKPD